MSRPSALRSYLEKGSRQMQLSLLFSFSSPPRRRDKETDKGKEGESREHTAGGTLKKGKERDPREERGREWYLRLFTYTVLIYPLRRGHAVRKGISRGPTSALNP